MKTSERAAARALRREGRSIKGIARALAVAPSTVSRWVRDIELTEVQRAALCAANGHHERQLAARSRRVHAAREQRREHQAAGRRRAAHGCELHLIGCMLYWAEGWKNRNQVRFANSDPEMIRLFVDFLRDCFELDEDTIQLTCNLYADHADRVREVEEHWLVATGLPRSCLYPSIVNVYSRGSARKRANKLPFGTCHVRVHRTDIVQHIFGAIQEYAGFDRPAWLD